MRAINALFVLTMLSLFTLPAAVAADSMKPGLWEMSMKSDAMKNMPQISPEQREQMRKMGIHVPQTQDGAMVSRACFTKEMVAQNKTPMTQNESGCEVKNQKQSGSSYSMDLVCDGPNMKGNGKITGQMKGGESFTSNYQFKGTMRGEPVNQKQENSGKWISADCGNVKPIAPPAAKK
jgi:Protein of unknown function (DUF3617)